VTQYGRVYNLQDYYLPVSTKETWKGKCGKEDIGYNDYIQEIILTAPLFL
jgi:hypothetical protein